MADPLEAKLRPYIAPGGLLDSLERQVRDGSLWTLPREHLDAQILGLITVARLATVKLLEQRAAAARMQARLQQHGIAAPDERPN